MKQRDDFSPLRVKKHSSLIQIQADLTLNQRKLINGLIFLIRNELKADEGLRVFHFEL